MNIFDILILIPVSMLLLYAVSGFVYVIRKNKYQKLWNNKKAMTLRVDPAISRAELCEQYVMFCKRNNCNVEF